jgi:tryptophan-rich sensory protein
MIFFAADDRNKRALLAFILGTQLVGVAASLFTGPNIEGWYQGLNKPDISPPNWVFAPVWITLYLLMAIAAWRVWRVVGLNSREMVLYFVQLGLNFAWSFIFFQMHRIDMALIEIGTLLALIVVTANAFRRRDGIAGLLFLPYMAWVGFAMALNAEILKLNS